MTEVLIRPNVRAVSLGFVLPLIMLLAAGGAWYIGSKSTTPLWWQILAGVLIALAGICTGLLFHLTRQPRLAREGREFLVYLQAASPLRVPVDVVECFFKGQAEGLLRDETGRETEVSTVIVRLSEAATEWHHRDVKPTLGLWCEGYITIRGTWCEPITADLMRRLNQRLVEIQRQYRSEEQLA